MDKNQDLILGVLGTQWERTRPGGVESYLESIKRSGFSGRKVMLVWDIHTYTRELLLKAGFELVDLPTPSEPFFTARMRVCWEYLRDHFKEFRYIFWLDVKDLVLQSDPSIWMENDKGNVSIIASTECVPIEHEETNKLWAQSILGESRYQEIKSCEVINGGTWAGEAEAMSEVFHQVHLGCSVYTGGFPPCQIWINYVLHTIMQKDMRIPRWSEGFAACLHPCWSPWRVPCWPYMRDPHPVLDVKTCNLYAGTTPNPKNQMIVFNPVWGNNVRVPQLADRKIIIETPSRPLQGVECVDKPEGKLLTIVQGYDRDWDMKVLFEYKYRAGADFNFKNVEKQQETAAEDLLDAYKKYNAEYAKYLPVTRRGLRRVQREGTIGNSQLSCPRRIFNRHT
jgi:hypothetical protein